MLWLISATPENNTSKAGGLTEVKIIQNKKSVYLLPTPVKSLKTGKRSKGTTVKSKGKVADLAKNVSAPPPNLLDYGDKIKMIVDPLWFAKVKPFLPNLNTYIATIILIKFDKYGNILSVKIVKSSGFREIDQIALDTLREIGKLPEPPASLIQDGIEWEFSVGQRS